MAISNTAFNIKCGVKKNLSNQEIKDGTLYVATKDDNKAELYADFNNSRYLISDASTVDSKLSATSENALQNKAIYSELTNIQSQIQEKADTKHRHVLEDVVVTNSSSVGYIDAITGSKIGAIASNKTFGLQAEDITIEYSTDGGENWLDYMASDAEKRSLFCETRSKMFYLGKNTTPSADSENMMLRVTLKNTDRYVSLLGMYVRVQTNGNTLFVDLDHMRYADSEFQSILKKKELKGWSGDSVHYFPTGINFNKVRGTDWNSHTLRITFYSEKINSSYVSPGILDIRFLGNDAWTVPNDMVLNNHLYHWDTNLNVIFPTQVISQASGSWGFVGNLKGNAETASALKLSSAVGSATQPVYIDATGKPQVANKFLDNYYTKDVFNNFILASSANEPLSLQIGDTRKIISNVYATHIKNINSNTTKGFLLTSSASNTTPTYDDSIYTTEKSGELVVPLISTEQVNLDSGVTMQYNSTDKALEFVFK